MPSLSCSGGGGEQLDYGRKLEPGHVARLADRLTVNELLLMSHQLYPCGFARVESGQWPYFFWVYVVLRPISGCGLVCVSHSVSCIHVVSPESSLASGSTFLGICSTSPNIRLRPGVRLALGQF
jgi:hypothetical protein